MCRQNDGHPPFFQRQPLKDVVIRYGLSEGIRDNILKDVSDSIRSYSYATSDAARFVRRSCETSFRSAGT